MFSLPNLRLKIATVNCAQKFSRTKQGVSIPYLQGLFVENQFKSPQQERSSLSLHPVGGRVNKG